MRPSAKPARFLGRTDGGHASWLVAKRIAIDGKCFGGFWPASAAEPRRSFSQRVRAELDVVEIHRARRWSVSCKIG
jgi:hypothetical protein